MPKSCCQCTSGRSQYSTGHVCSHCLTPSTRLTCKRNEPLRAIRRCRMCRGVLCAANGGLRCNTNVGGRRLCDSYTARLSGGSGLCVTTRAMLATWSGELFRYDRQSLKLSCWNKKAGADAPASSQQTISAGWSATQSAFFIHTCSSCMSMIDATNTICMGLMDGALLTCSMKA